MIKINRKEIGCQDLDWIHVAQTKDQSWDCMLFLFLLLSAIGFQAMYTSTPSA
jgi:hypothetical protein